MENLKILVLGKGFVGEPLAEYLGADISTKRLNQIGISDLESYDVVINTVAKTKIDWCEKNREETFDTNVIQAINIAKLLRPDQKYVFFSSGCIFKSENGEVNYEDSIPNPQCFYTYTKLMAEQLLEEVRPETLVIRPRLLISEKSHPRNTIDKLLNYDKIIVCQESVTILEDLITKVATLFNESGAFNIFNEGTISPSEIMDIFGHKHEKIDKTQLDELTKGLARRVSTVLGSKRTDPLPDARKRILEIKATWI